MSTWQGVLDGTRTRAAGVAAAVCSILLVFAAPLAGQARLGPELDDRLAGLAPEEAITVIVTFEGAEPPSAAQIEAVKSIGITKGTAFRSLPVMGVEATAAQVRELAAMPGVRSIWPNAELEYHGPPDVGALLEAASSLSAAAVNGDATELTGVDRVRASAEFTALNGGVPVRGRGVAIVINDSGIDATHADAEFGSAVIENVFVPPALLSDDFQPPVFAEGVPNTDLNVGHGTFVAGNAAGRGVRSGGKYEGVASGAKLIGVGSGAGLFILNTLAAYDYMLTHQFDFEVPIRVINNSWGPVAGGRYNPADPVAVANKLAHDRGIVVVFSAGNEGPGGNTLNPYAEDPNTIGVAAGTDAGTVTGFSSRGIRGELGPDVTAPGNLIVSLRASTGVVLDALDAVDDATVLTPAELPFYTIASGTSFSAPHVAGIVALLLEANPALSPDEVKQILRETATPMPGTEEFQVGTGYVNAFAAVQKAFDLATPFGAPLQEPDNSEFVTERTETLLEDEFDIGPTEPSNRVEFEIDGDASLLSVEVDFGGFEELGQGNLNPLLLEVFDPEGNRHVAINGLLILGPSRLEVIVSNPIRGAWSAEVKAFTPLGVDLGNTATLPDRVRRTVKAIFFEVDGVDDIAGHPAQGAVEFVIARGFLLPEINEKFRDDLAKKHRNLFKIWKKAVEKAKKKGFPTPFWESRFAPDEPVIRADLATSFGRALSVRQFLPLAGGRTFADVDDDLLPFVEGVTARGAALRDLEQDDPGVMEGRNGSFDAEGTIDRSELARSLVRGLGLEGEAQARMSDDIVVFTCAVEEGVPLEDQGAIPAGFRGHVSLALELGLLNAFCELEQGPFDLEPTITAQFRPLRTVSRAEAAVAEMRYFRRFFSP